MWVTCKSAHATPRFVLSASRAATAFHALILLRFEDNAMALRSRSDDCLVSSPGFNKLEASSNNSAGAHSACLCSTATEDALYLFCNNSTWTRIALKHVTKGQRSTCMSSNSSCAIYASLTPIAEKATMLAKVRGKTCEGCCMAGTAAISCTGCMYISGFMFDNALR